MAAQIPIVAAPSTPGIARNSKKRPASPSHNCNSGAGYSASKKKKVSGSGFAQVLRRARIMRMRGDEWVQERMRDWRGGAGACAVLDGARVRCELR